MVDVPACRNSDRLLYQFYLERHFPSVFDRIGHIKPEMSSQAVSASKIERLRRIIQGSERRLLPTCWKIARERRVLRVAWEAWVKAEKLKGVFP